MGYDKIFGKGISFVKSVHSPKMGSLLQFVAEIHERTLLGPIISIQNLLILHSFGS